MSAVDEVLAVLQARIGMGEDAAGANEITRWYADTVDTSFPPGSWEWCAAGVSFAFAHSHPELMRSRAWVPHVALDAQAAGTWSWGSTGLATGGVVIFDWNRRFNSVYDGDHVGIVERVFAGGMYVLEPNGPGERLGRIQRDFSYVLGFASPAYSTAGDATTPASKPATPPAASRVDEDGALGPATIRAWQAVMGTTVDGVIDPQGSQLVKAVQAHLNAAGARDERGHSLAVDGEGIQPNLGGARVPTSGTWHTIYALQAYLGTTQDGYLSPESQGGSSAIRVLQQRLNAGRF